MKNNNHQCLFVIDNFKEIECVRCYFIEKHQQEKEKNKLLDDENYSLMIKLMEAERRIRILEDTAYFKKILWINKQRRLDYGK